LARFFPTATPVRIPIKLSRAHGNGSGDDSDYARAHPNGDSGPARHVYLQDTVIEFGTPQEVLFMVDHPLEFADHGLIESNDGALRVQASVVAVQYHPERIAVAARFLEPVPNWIVKL
jgi:hypothetical protein